MAALQNEEYMFRSTSSRLDAIDFLFFPIIDKNKNPVREFDDFGFGFLEREQKTQRLYKLLKNHNTETTTQGGGFLLREIKENKKV